MNNKVEKDKPTNNTPSRWGVQEWVFAGFFVAVLAVFVFFVIPNKHDFAERFGYTATVTAETTTENVNATVVATTSSAGARFLRDAVIGILALLTLIVAIWRAFIHSSEAKTAEYQAKTMAEQAKTAAEQAKTATEQAKVSDKQTKLENTRLLHERLTNAGQLLSQEGKEGMPAISARVNGVNIMADLATQLPKVFAEQVVKNLIAYIKDNIQVTARPLPNKQSGDYPDRRMLGEDVKTAFAVLHRLLSDDEIKARIDDAVLDFAHQNFAWLVLDDSQVQLRHYKNWTKTTFEGSNLTRAHFGNGAILQEADFSKASLRFATLAGVNLSPATMTAADLTDADLQKANLRFADLRWATLVNAKMQGANMRLAKMQGANLSDAKLHKAQDGEITILGDAFLTGARLESTDLRDANLRGAYLFGAIISANLRGAELDACYGETYMPKAVIDKNQLSDTEKGSMEGCIWCFGASWAEGIIEQSQLNIKWELEEYNDGYALAGVLVNFAGAPDSRGSLSWRWRSAGLYGEPGNIRRQTAALKELPEDMPEEIREWVRQLQDGG